MRAELKAKHESKRIVLGATAWAFANLTLLLTLYWGSVQIREAGMPSWGVALLCLGVLGSISAILTYGALKSSGTRSPHGARNERQA